MNKIADEINQDRRRFFGAAAMAFAVTQLGMIGTRQRNGRHKSLRSSPEQIRRSDR